jgi:predicted NUDIX family NTP pyrophosphohydrolase
VTTPNRTLVSAGLLMYRRRQQRVELFIVHPGGPFFRNRDVGVWTIPKGIIEDGEEPQAAAEREFHEETGLTPAGPFLPLTPVRQKGGKLVMAWAFEGEADPERITCNTFAMEWPPRSGRIQRYPEVDRAAFYSPVEARLKLNPAQAAFVDELVRLLGLDQPVEAS